MEGSRARRNQKKIVATLRNVNTVRRLAALLAKPLLLLALLMPHDASPQVPTLPISDVVSYRFLVVRDWGVGCASSCAWSRRRGASGDAPLDARSDIYSLGALAYFLAPGSPLFLRDSVVQVLAAHIGEAVAPGPHSSP